MTPRRRKERQRLPPAMRKSGNPRIEGKTNPPKMKVQKLPTNPKHHLPRKQMTKVPSQRVLQNLTTPAIHHLRTKNLTPEKEQAARTKNPCVDADPVSKRAKP